MLVPYVERTGEPMWGTVTKPDQVVDGRDQPRGGQVAVEQQLLRFVDVEAGVHAVPHDCVRATRGVPTTWVGVDETCSFCHSQGREVVDGGPGPDELRDKAPPVRRRDVAARWSRGCVLMAGHVVRDTVLDAESAVTRVVSAGDRTGQQGGRSDDRPPTRDPSRHVDRCYAAGTPSAVATVVRQEVV